MKSIRPMSRSWTRTSGRMPVRPPTAGTSSHPGRPASKPQPRRARCAGPQPRRRSQRSSARRRRRDAAEDRRDGRPRRPESGSPRSGQTDQLQLCVPSPQLAARIANGIADSFIDSGLQRRYEASAYARNFLQQQIAKTRGDLEKSERELVAYAQAEGIINTATGEPGSSGGDASSLQGESLYQLEQGLADATARRVSGRGAYRQAQLGGLCRRRAGHERPAPEPRHTRSRISGKTHADEARSSGHAQPALAHRRTRPADRP